jgi:hypothetical protein
LTMPGKATACCEVMIVIMTAVATAMVMLYRVTAGYCLSSVTAAGPGDRFAAAVFASLQLLRVAITRLLFTLITQQLSAVITHCHAAALCCFHTLLLSSVNAQRLSTVITQLSSTVVTHHLSFGITQLLFMFIYSCF